MCICTACLPVPERPEEAGITCPGAGVERSRILQTESRSSAGAGSASNHSAVSAAPRLLSVYGPLSSARAACQSMVGGCVQEKGQLISGRQWSIIQP